MARTGGVPKPDKSLKGPMIDWAGRVIRDGRGYGGRPEHVSPGTSTTSKTGAFPAIPVADTSRRHFNPSEALRAEIEAAKESNVTTVTYRDGTEVVTETPAKKQPERNALKEFWAKLRADPAAMEDFLAKKKAGFAKWRAKKKGKHA